MPAAAYFPTSCTPLRNVSIGLFDFPAIAIILRYVAAAKVVNVAQEIRIAVSKQKRQTLSVSEWLMWGIFSMAIKRGEQGRNDYTSCNLLLIWLLIYAKMKRSAALLLKSLYLDSSSPVYLAGETTIFNFVRENYPEASIGLDDVRAFLARQPVHSLHKPVRRIFPRVPIRSNYVDALWMADLIDMTKHSRANDTHKWILTVIDTFSRFAFAVPVRTKSANDVSIALERLLTESRRQPDAIVTDDGKEFSNNRCDE